MSPALRWLAVGLVIVGGAVTGAYVRDRQQHRAGPAPVVHELTAAPAAGPPAQVPARRPDFTLNDPAGKPHALAEWDGRLILVNFWATWCAPCRREIPLLNRLAGEPAAKDLTVLGVAVDFPDDVRAFLAKMPVGYPVLIGEQDGMDAAAAFGVQDMAFPFTAFIDRHGRVFSVHLGELHEADVRATLALIDRVDAGQLDIEAARRELAAATPGKGPRA